MLDVALTTRVEQVQTRRGHAPHRTQSTPDEGVW